jgi:Holliday junction resolvase RusA-like endonuclease
MMRMTIPGKLPSYNDLNKGHWSQCAKVKSEAMRTVGWIINAYHLRPVAGKVTVTIRCYEPNAKRDDDNVTSGAAKVILDALKNKGIIKNDGQRYVRCVKCPTMIDRENPRVEVEIEEAG